jgi:hypothetical protein
LRAGKRPFTKKVSRGYVNISAPFAALRALVENRARPWCALGDLTYALRALGVFIEGRKGAPMAQPRARKKTLRHNNGAKGARKIT